MSVRASRTRGPPALTAGRDAARHRAAAEPRGGLWHQCRLRDGERSGRGGRTTERERRAGPENLAKVESFIRKVSHPSKSSCNVVVMSSFGRSLASSVQPLPQSTTPSPFLPRASSLAPTENPSTPSLPVTPRQPSQRSTCMAQANSCAHLAPLLRM